MSRTLKVPLFAAAGLAVILLIAALALPFLLDIDGYRRQLEERIAQTTGMEFRIGGLELGFLPGLQVVASDLHLGPAGADVASAGRIEIGLDILPLLRGEASIRRIALHDAVISIERYPDGGFNVEKRESFSGTRPELDIRELSIVNTTLHFRDGREDDEYEFSDCDIEVDDARLARRDTDDELAGLSLDMEFACAAIRRDDVRIEGVKFSLSGREGIFDFVPEMTLFGSELSGKLHADHTGAVPRYEMEYSLPQLRIEAFLAALGRQPAVEGAVDFFTRLHMQGASRDELKAGLSGEASLRGQNLLLHGTDLDEEFELFETSQNFNLVDAGALLFAGPLGVLATKGYDFANLLQSEGTSEIRALVSDWNIADGVARAEDVAIATQKNRLALAGALDFSRGEFVGMKLALLDAKGCATIEQAIHGSLQDPEMEKPGVLQSLAGPAISLLERGMELLPGGEEEECEPFYTGSLALPQ